MCNYFEDLGLERDGKCWWGDVKDKVFKCGFKFSNVYVVLLEIEGVVVCVVEWWGGVFIKKEVNLFIKVVC